MDRLICALLLAASTAMAVCQDPGTVRKATTNFATDIKGEPDTRPDTWGTAGVVVKTITFKPAEGCAVQIVEVIGDFLFWPDFLAVPAGTHAGTLLALTPTQVFDCPYSDYTEDSDFLYIQGGTSGEVVRIPINQTVIDGYLLPDNKLNVTFATYLNDTGTCIHMEATLQIRFRFVDPDLAKGGNLRRPTIRTKWSSVK